MKLKVHILILIICIIAGISHPGLAQQKTKITLVRANDLRYDKRIGENIERLIGDVILRQDSTWFYCDSAYLNKKKNNFDWDYQEIFYIKIHILLIILLIMAPFHMKQSYIL